jgi:hypothetical protein
MNRVARGFTPSRNDGANAVHSRIRLRVRSRSDYVIERGLFAMHWPNQAHDINTWWEGAPEERYWLDVTDRLSRGRVLVTPRVDAKHAESWARHLITCVRAGDVVFHYDLGQQAIDSWSISDGRVEKIDLSWRLPAATSEDGTTTQVLPSWRVHLRNYSMLSGPVPLNEIARIQWSLFPALRALEDRVGDPLYYPFAMGNRLATRPLSGYVFKLPGVFVQGFPELVSAARLADRVHADLETSPSWRPVNVENHRVAVRS